MLASSLYRIIETNATIETDETGGRFPAHDQFGSIRLTWAAYDGQFIRLKQGKTGARVTIPVGRALKKALDERKAQLGRKSAENDTPYPITVLATTRGTPWTDAGFGASFGKARKAAGVTGVAFHDLRGTAVTRLAQAECSVPEIATITGHSLKDVEAILDAHYLKRDEALAVSAIRKLERRAKRPTKRPTVK